ncbi:MAG: hypothetical protein WCI71_19785, partial [Bacteroidota bacterium]
MKKIVLLFLWLFLFVFSDTGYCGNGGTKKTDNGGNLAAEGTIAILNTPDLQNLTHKWVDAFTGLNPGFTIKAGQISGYSNTGLSSGTGLMLLSDDYYHNLKNKSAWNMVIGRDVIVPVINSKNPFLNELQQRGLTAEEFAMLFNNPDRRNWGIVAAKGEKIPVHLYISSDASVQTQIASFLNTDRVPTTGVTTGSDESVQTALQNDPYAIVFCNLVNILDVTGNNFVGNLQILPVDKNRNGRMDYFEKIYENPGNFLRGVWIGKYPQALCRNIYAVSNGKPENAAEIAFLQWVLTGGQQFLGPNGYSCLVSSERQSNLAGLQSGEIYIASSGGPSAFQVVSIAMIFLVIAGFILSMLFQYRKHKHEITGKIIY